MSKGTDKNKKSSHVHKKDVKNSDKKKKRSKAEKQVEKRSALTEAAFAKFYNDVVSHVCTSRDIDAENLDLSMASAVVAVDALDAAPLLGIKGKASIEVLDTENDDQIKAFTEMFFSHIRYHNVLEQPGRLHADDESIDRYCKKMLSQISKGKTECLLYRDERGQYCAFAVYSMKHIPTAPQRTLFIDELFVDENHRRSGIAKKLLARAEEKALELGCSVLSLDCLTKNKGARKLYEGFGMEKEKIRFAKVLN